MAELEKKTDKAEDLKKALSLFTFQGQMERYKPQRGSRLPLVPMLASLREMSPRQWAAYAFAATRCAASSRRSSTDCP